MWSKNQELKDQFVKVLEEFILNGKINTHSEFPSLHKILSDTNSQYFKQFYDKLNKSEGGKDFVFNEFTSRLT
jgi:hypothetical protein